jgi:glycosyl transferase family 4
MVMRRVLLITYCYPPTEVIGSVRPGALAKYLPRFGWEPLVLTPRVRQTRSDSGMIETDYRDVISSWKTRLGLDNKRSMHEQFRLPISAKPGAGFLHSRVFDLGKYVVSYPDPTKGWIPFALQAIKDIRDQGQEIDAILTTSPPISAHLIGSRAKAILGCPWIADLRDLWTQNFAHSNPLLNRLQAGLERRTLGQADALVTVSTPWAARLQEKYASRTVLTITNGFDPDDFAEIPKKLTENFTITYAGRLYQGGRNPKVLFEVLRDLVDENVVSPKDVRVRFYGEVEPWLTALVSQYRLEELVGVFGMVTRNESLQRQAESQILLLLGWADPRETGQHSGKLFENFGAARPILAIGGSRGVLTEALEETHAGVHALSKEQARNFLVTAYGEFKAKGRVPYHGEETAIDRYTHLRMAGQFADLLNLVSHKSQASEVAAGASL